MDVPFVFVSYVGLPKKFCAHFKLYGKHLQTWFYLIMMWEGTWGVKISCSKNGFFGVLRAQRAFGARQVFGTIFDYIQNFLSDGFPRLFFVASKNAFFENGKYPSPPICVLDTFVLGRMEKIPHFFFFGRLILFSANISL